MVEVLCKKHSWENFAARAHWRQRHEGTASLGTYSSSRICASGCRYAGNMDRRNRPYGISALKSAHLSPGPSRADYWLWLARPGAKSWRRLALPKIECDGLSFAYCFI